MVKNSNNKTVSLAIEQSLIKQIKAHKQMNQPRIIKKLERHLKTIQRAIDNLE